ncbi:hypothetical protein C4D60_Mb06t25920 [Musa balbisiana]|uniref:Uncharacterized protein n=1 Tax=Musa balbisiana TaxID=52838 RepID=A0A4S8IT78_MUSBA|nr:hypothetical protein C4D60_Mb06t25920 [Musa balbisiana]
MGGRFSRRPSMVPARQDSGSGGGGAPSDAGQNGIPYTAELSNYEAACRDDPDLRSFDATLQRRTSHAISTLALGVELRSLSFNTLSEVTGCLLDTNKEVVDAILESKKDIWKNPELFDLANDYFDCSIQTLDYCTELEKCLKRARDSHLIIHFALQHFQNENKDNDEMEIEDGKRKYAMTLEKLRHFKAAGNPFTEEFSQVFQSVYRQQQLMLEKLLLRKKKLDKKLRSINAWRKVSNIIFVSALAAVVICSVVAAAVAAPPVAAALAAACTIPIGSAGKWINSLLKNYQNALGGERDLLSSMQFGTCIALKDLDTIRLMVDNLEIHFNSLSESADFALKDVEAMKFAIEEIKRKLEQFTTSIENLGVQVDRCSRDIRKTRTVVLQRIMKHPIDDGIHFSCKRSKIVVRRDC